MKYAKISLVILYTAALSAKPFLSQWAQRVQGGAGFESHYAPSFSERTDYTKGGVAVTYPSGHFSKPPAVYISIELKNLTYSPYLIVQPIITFNTAEGTRILVNKHIPGILTNIITEADTDDVVLTIFAFERD